MRSILSRKQGRGRCVSQVLLWHYRPLVPVYHREALEPSNLPNLDQHHLSAKESSHHGSQLINKQINSVKLKISSSLSPLTKIRQNSLQTHHTKLLNYSAGKVIFQTPSWCPSSTGARVCLQPHTYRSLPAFTLLLVPLWGWSQCNRCN